MIADLDKLRELNLAGRLHPHNFGPDPETVIKLFETKPLIWRAHLNQHDEGGVTHYTIPTIIADEKKGTFISDTDIRNTIRILGNKFYGCDALKIQAGAEFGGRVKNKPGLIFIWWD